MQQITHADRHAEGELNKAHAARWSAHASSMCARGMSVGVCIGESLPREPRRSERLNLRLKSISQPSLDMIVTGLTPRTPKSWSVH